MIAVIENIGELQEKHAITRIVYEISNSLTIISIISYHKENAGEMSWYGLNI